jgi:MFS family permease
VFTLASLTSGARARDARVADALDGAGSSGAGGSGAGPDRSEPSRPGATGGDAAVERHNQRLHILEGTALMGALGAINANTVGTSLVESLGGAPWMVALMPMAATLGFALGPILSAHRLDRSGQFLPALRWSLPFSRLPILLTAVVLWVGASSVLSMWTVLLSSIAYGIIGGLSVGAWQQLILRTVRPDQRPSLFAVRYLFANLLGLGVASLVGPILARWPGTRGYALLHAIAFGGAMIAYRLLMAVREPVAAPPPVAPHRGFFENLRAVPALFAADRRLSSYLFAVVLVNSQFLLMGFLAVHALQLLGQDHSYVGTLTSAQMVGAVAGSFVAARVGRRCCSRTLLVASRVLLLAVSLGAMIATRDYAFRALFAMYGAATWVNLVGHNTLTLELLPAARRSTVLAVFSLVQVPSMLIAAELGAWLWQAGVAFNWIAGLCALGIAASLIGLLPSSPVLAAERG